MWWVKMSAYKITWYCGDSTTGRMVKPSSSSGLLTMGGMIIGKINDRLYYMFPELSWTDEFFYVNDEPIESVQYHEADEEYQYIFDILPESWTLQLLQLQADLCSVPYATLINKGFRKE